MNYKWTYEEPAPAEAAAATSLAAEAGIQPPFGKVLPGGGLFTSAASPPFFKPPTPPLAEPFP